MSPTPEVFDVIVIGAGQAGLATAYHLRQRGLRFLVVDAAPQLGHSWRSRWDSLRLFTPAQYDGLPGMPFPAPADTHPTKDEVADYLAGYAARFALPLMLDCRVDQLEHADGRYQLHTSRGLLEAHQVVVATGPFQTPHVPHLASALGDEVSQLHSSAYRRPDDVPAGPVLVVGAGNSGRQIALELATAHPGVRQVALATGAEPLELPQRVLGRDLFWWLTRLGVITRTPDSLLARRMRARGDLVIGTPLARLRIAGVTIHPRLHRLSADQAHFEDGSTHRPATVVWATGFRTDYSWITIPGVLLDGQVVHDRGRTRVPGLFFVGLPWQHTRGSSLLGFVQHDAEWVATHLTTSDRKEALS